MTVSSSGSHLLATLATLPSDLPTALVVRHAERYPIEDFATADGVPLTPAGERAAAAFGAGLPAARPLQVWHSRIARCGTTARRIAEGFAAAGGQAVFHGELDSLCGSFVLDFDRVAALTRGHGGAGSHDFVRRWFDGHFDPAVIEPCAVAAGHIMTGIVPALAGAAPGSLLVLVTHDWEIMTLRETYLGARHENVGWVDFLDGLVIARDGAEWRFGWKGFAARRAS